MLTHQMLKEKGLNVLQVVHLKKHFPKGMPLVESAVEKMSELLDWDSLAKAFLSDPFRKSYFQKVETAWGSFLTAKFHADIVSWDNRELAIASVIAARKEFVKAKGRIFAELYLLQD
jgi:predicted GTPase